MLHVKQKSGEKAQKLGIFTDSVSWWICWRFNHFGTNMGGDNPHICLFQPANILAFAKFFLIKTYS